MSSRRGLGVFILTVCFSFISVCNGTSTATVQTTDPTNFNMGSTQEMSTNDSPTTKPTTAIITTTGGVVSTKGLTQDTSTNNFPTTKPTTETTAILIATTGGVVSTKRSTQDTSTNDSPTTKPTTETTTTIGLITTTGGVVSTKGSTQKKSTNDSPTTTTTLIHSTSYDTTTQDNKGPSPITNIDTTVAKITSTLYSTTGPMKEATTSSSTTTKPPKYYLISIENSGVNVKLNIPSDEFDENKFKSSIAENTIMYCTAENSKCEDNYKYISSSDVIIYHQGSKPYFEVNTEYDILADDELHVSFYVKDPYTDTLTVMNTEQATSMLNEQKGNIEEELNYEFEIETPYTKPDGFPGWAISLIVFCVICIFVAIYVFWRAKKLGEKKNMYGIELEDLEKGTQATQAEIIAEMNRDRHEENAYEKINEPNETNAAIQTRYGDIIAETGAPAVEKYLNKSLSDKNKSATNGHAWVAAEGAVSSKPDRNENIDDNGKLDDMTPMPPPPPPPVEFSEVDVHRDDWQKDDFPEPPSSPLDLDVAAEEATSELVNLVKEQAAELENTGIDNQAFQPDDGTIRTEL